MKEEIEFKWIVNLLNSEFVKGITLFKGQKSGCKSDFEKAAKAPENSKEFRKWFDVMIVIGCFDGYEFKEINGNKIRTFVIIEKNLKKVLHKNTLYSNAKIYFDKELLSFS